jgi:hypothetical protein
MYYLIAVIAVGCTVAVQWRKARQAELEAALKSEMLQLRMSADDIVKVLGATATVSPAEIVKLHDYHLAHRTRAVVPSGDAAQSGHAPVEADGLLCLRLIEYANNGSRFPL